MRTFLIAIAVAVCVPLALAGQDAAQVMKDYSRILQSDDLPNPWDSLPSYFADLLAALE